jgi:mRNA-degrading endonuclease toxin of MazEF toxin-antitoxin module
VSSPTPGARPLYQGRILEATVPDRRGGNHKRRPLVIITPTEDIEPGKPFQVVCLSTKITEYPSIYNVFIPGPRPGKKAITLISQDCVAVCEWVLSIKESDIAGLLGPLPPRYLLQVLQKRAEYEKTLAPKD